MKPEVSYNEATCAFGTEIPMSQITKIIFLDTLIPATKNAVDVSQDQDGSVLAWAAKKGTGYHLYIAAEGGVYAPADCSFMFASYANLETISFSDNFITSNTTDMSAMFYGCTSLTEINLSNFDTSRVVLMGSMFYACSKLKTLDLSSFNTGNVQDMGKMFHRCDSLMEINLSNFNTDKVFRMAFMFYETPSLKNVNSDFDIRNVEEGYECFMDPGDTFNGRPWEELFQ